MSYREAWIWLRWRFRKNRVFMCEMHRVKYCVHRKLTEEDYANAERALKDLDL